MPLTIGLTYDLRQDYLARGHSAEEVAEFDSEATIDALDATIRSLGHRTVRIGHAWELCRRLVDGQRWDLVFNIAEGLRGRNREAQVPCLLELFGVPYVGSDGLTCAVTLDKAVAKRLVAAAGLLTARFHVVAAEADLDAIVLPYPLFAKPLAEGTGKGIDARSRIDSPARLREVCRSLLAQFAQPVLVEEYLPGREFTTAVLGAGSAARVLGTMEVEIVSHAGDAIYSYENKEKCEELVRYSALARSPLRDETEALALAAYRTLECRDMGRVDVRCDGDGRPAFIELNPLPGIHPTHSDLPMIATQEGLPYEKLIDAIIRSACDRLGIVP
jgi:D-alanine-D-alanine ligase